jgi:hypothetical protein
MIKRKQLALSLFTILALGLCSLPVLPQAYSALTTTIKNNLKILGGNLSFQTFSATAQGVYGNLLSINVPNPGQTTVLTIPDPGAGTANVLLDQGVTSAVTQQHITVPITSTQILGMYATPVLLIAAPPAGENIIVDYFEFTMIPSGTAYASGGAFAPQISNTNHSGGTLVTGTIAASVINASGTTTTYNMQTQVAHAGTAATGLYLSNATGSFTTGTGTAICDIWYSIK